MRPPSPTTLIATLTGLAVATASWAGLTAAPGWRPPLERARIAAVPTHQEEPTDSWRRVPPASAAERTAPPATAPPDPAAEPRPPAPGAGAEVAAATVTSTTTTSTTAAPATTTTSTTTSTAPMASASSWPRDHECESSMLRWMNETRAEEGTPALAHDPAIHHVPVDWSVTMADRGQLAHNPEYADHVFAARPEATTAGENVGRSAASARAVYDEFLRSATHRDKIAGTRFTHAAVGCVRDADDQLWVTVNFWG